MLTTLEIAKRFEKAKFTKPQSEAIATVIKEVVAGERGDYVTERVFQAEIGAFRSDMDSKLKGLRSDMEQGFTEQDSKIDGLRSEMNRRFTEQDTKIDCLGVELKANILEANSSQLRWIMGILTAQTALIVTIIFALIKYLQSG